MNFIIQWENAFHTINAFHVAATSKTHLSASAVNALQSAASHSNKKSPANQGDFLFMFHRLLFQFMTMVCRSAHPWRCHPTEYVPPYRSPGQLAVR